MVRYPGRSEACEKMGWIGERVTYSSAVALEDIR